MTNLTDLLPAGAGGKQVSFTASGAISSGKPVILNANGTVTEVAETSISESIGSPVNFAGANTGYIYSTFDSTNNKIIVINNDASNAVTEVRVGTVSGTSISFGSDYTTSSGYNNVCDYSPDDEVVLFVYTRDSNNYLYARAATISGTVVSFGTEQYLGITGAPQAYDLTYIGSSKFIAVIRDNGNSGYGTGMVLTVSGTSISYGSKYVFNSGSINNGSSASGATSSQVVITYTDNGNSSRGAAQVATISGTAISYGSQLLVTSGSTVGNSGNVRYIDSVDRFVYCYKDSANSGYGTAIVLSQSGTSVSTAGSAVVFASANTEHASGIYNSIDDKYTIFYKRNSSPPGSKYIVGTVSTTSISFGSISEFDTNDSRNYERYATTYDSNANRVVCFYYRNSSPFEGYVVVLRNAGVETNSADFVGIADEAISDTASGNITIKGGVASNGLSGLTPNATYYVQDDGTLSTTSSSVTAGKALSATSINLDYSS
jgi:hypothetical protein